MKHIFKEDLVGLTAEKSGQYYRTTSGQYRSAVIHDEKTVYKDISGFGGDIDLANECTEVWKSQGWTGAPSSPASFFRRVYRNKLNIKASANHLISGHFHGGWVESFSAKSVSEPVYHYDLNSAYLWSGGLKLPKKMRAYRPGDTHFIALFRHAGDRLDLPRYFGKKGKIVVTSDDIETYDLQGEVIRGYAWDALDYNPLDDVNAIYERGDLPEKAIKLITQSYWGIWAASEPLVVETWKNGQCVKKRKQYNYYRNLLYATIIIHRVIRRVWEAARWNSVLVFVDSVLKVGERLQTGTRHGDWKLEGIYEKGIYIYAPGVWDTLPVKHPQRIDQWKKHSGFQRKKVI